MILLDANLLVYAKVASLAQHRPVVRVPVPGDRHRKILGNLARTSVDRANLIPDAQLATMAIENGFVLCSTDRDFARFPGLQWQNPLEMR